MGDQLKQAKTADLLRESANKFFRAKDYNKAIDCYTSAIELAPDNAVLYANRSFSHLKLECYDSALKDAEKALKLNPGYVKGYYRRACAYMSMGNFKKALGDLEEVCKRSPNTRDGRIKLEECKNTVKKLNFAKAIASEERKSLFDDLDLDTIIVESDYAGPALEGKITKEFVEDLMEMYKSTDLNLHKKYAYKILKETLNYLKKQPTLIDVSIKDDEKFTVCGDIHGQFFDLMQIFDMNGVPSPNNPYLFNGDFVDRGSFSVQCIFTLLAFKLLYPTKMFMARGNHESVTMNQIYGFEGEVKAKYNASMVEAFTEVYNWLPLAHCLNNRVLVMHGGLFSAKNVTLDDIRSIKRDRQPPESGLMCEILWSDPMEALGRAPSKRGVGIQFGPDVTLDFVTRNNLDYIIRSHEVKNDGYEITHSGKCITVFSAPNYCDTMGNAGAYLTMKGKDLAPKPHIFREVPHPDLPPMYYASSLLSIL